MADKKMFFLSFFPEHYDKAHIMIHDPHRMERNCAEIFFDYNAKVQQTNTNAMHKRKSVQPNTLLHKQNDEKKKNKIMYIYMRSVVTYGDDN